MEDLIYFSKQLEIISKESQMEEKKKNNSFNKNRTQILKVCSKKFYFII